MSAKRVPGGTMSLPSCSRGAAEREGFSEDFGEAMGEW
jgi:hypothetical protein